MQREEETSKKESHSKLDLSQPASIQNSSFLSIYKAYLSSSSIQSDSQLSHSLRTLSKIIDQSIAAERQTMKRVYSSSAFSFQLNEPSERNYKQSQVFELQHLSHEHSLNSSASSTDVIHLQTAYGQLLQLVDRCQLQEKNLLQQNKALKLLAEAESLDLFSYSQEQLLVIFQHFKTKKSYYKHFYIKLQQKYKKLKQLGRRHT